MSPAQRPAWSGVSAGWVVLTGVLVLVGYAPGKNRPLLVADAIVGASLLVAGLVTHRARPASRTGHLLILTGATWALGSVWAPATFVHRGPLVHVALGYPNGRLRNLPAVGLVAAGYVVACAPAVAGDAHVTLVWATLIYGVALLGYVRTPAPAKRAAFPGLVAALGFASVLALSAGNILGRWEADQAVLWCYEAVVLLVALGLLLDLLRSSWAGDAVAGLVVDLGDRDDTGLLRDELARTLGDQSLALAYWFAAQQRYVDDAGRPVTFEIHPPGRAVTRVMDGDELLAVLVHDPLLLSDPVLLDGVAAAARLTLSQARLRAAARSRVAEIVASRRRIVEAGDAQRRKLAAELESSVLIHLEHASARLRVLGMTGGKVGILAPELLDELARARAEIDDLAQGIRPRQLTDHGLDIALHALSTANPIPIDVDVQVGRLPDAVEAATYFLCCEALANAAKHARASRVAVTIVRDGNHLVATINDDGVGSADPQAGSGLRGITDRVEAVGGRLTIASEPGRGTQVRLDLHLDGQDEGMATRFDSCAR